MNHLIQRQTSLSAHAIQFGRFLRGHGFEVGPNEEIDLLKAFQTLMPVSFEEQQALYKAIWVKNLQQFLMFDELYQQYWKELSRAEDSKTQDGKMPEQKKKKPRQQQAPSLYALKSWLYGGRINEEQETAAYSAFEAIGKKDFSQFDSKEQKALLEIIRIIAKKLANKYSRRYVQSKSTKNIDLKNTIKQSLGKGGHIDQFLFKEQQKRKVNLVLICDVSKSMELYSKFLIEFMYGFQQVVHQLRAFVFSTRLVALSQILRNGNFKKVLENLSDQVPYWSGGTRIGASLEEFNTKYGNRILNKDTIVIILSDGWDTGELGTLEHAMRHIHKKSHRVIWINPLAGNPNYRPETKAMQTCLPYIDVFTSAHNLETLKAISKSLR